MKDVILEFLKLLSNSVLVLCLAFVSFLLIINLYHYKEIRSVYNTQSISNSDYIEYQELMKTVDKKMKSVNYKKIADKKAENVYKYYEICKNQLDNSTFENIGKTNTFDSKIIYDSNYELMNEFGKSCLFSYSFNIAKLYGNKVPSGLERVNDYVTEKSSIVVDNANYLIRSGYQNSSYYFTTDVFKLTIADRVRIEYNLTVNNYKTLASSLNDVADWYVSEFGGNS